MSDFNPFLIPQDDTKEVVGAQETPTEEVEESNTSSSVSRHVLTGPDGTELPEEVQKSFGRHLNVWGGADAQGSALPEEFRALRILLEFFATFPNYAQSGTLLLSVAEVVEELSDGRLSKVYQLHEAERKILWTTGITHFEDVVYKLLHHIGVNVHSTYEAEIGLYFETMLDIVKWYEALARKEYVEACEELGRAADEVFLEEAVYSERTHYAKVALGQPPAKRDV